MFWRLSTEQTQYKTCQPLMRAYRQQCSGQTASLCCQVPDWSSALFTGAEPLLLLAVSSSNIWISLSLRKTWGQFAMCTEQWCGKRRLCNRTPAQSTPLNALFMGLITFQHTLGVIGLAGEQLWRWSPTGREDTHTHTYTEGRHTCREEAACS